MNPNIVEKKPNGEVFGYYEGKLYKGIPKYIGFDELVFEDTIESDTTITRKSKYGDHVHSTERGIKPDGILPTVNQKVFRTGTNVDGTTSEVEVKICVYKWVKV